MDQVSQVAQAVLYEGYLLWPYRRSSTKNQQRWTFGGVFPPAWSAAHADDPSTLQCQCLVEGDGDTTVTVTLRFLQVVDRRVGEWAGDELRWVDELVVGEQRHLAWEEATERELEVALQPLGAPGGGLRLPLHITAGSDTETLTAADGGRAGAIVRSWEALEGIVEVGAEPVAPGLWRLTARVVNATPGDPDGRPAALRRSLVSTHLVLRVAGGAFVSLTDPPEPWVETAQGCENTGTWPVLVGQEGERHTMLAAPIILPDYPQVAPESPGNLFDATEIDHMLILNTLSLTEDEQREMRASDPRGREILERCAGLSPEELLRLNQGAIRELRTLREA